MVVGNHQYKVANLNQSKARFQLELSLAQFSPSLFLILLIIQSYPSSLEVTEQLTKFYQYAFFISIILWNYLII